ncbi:hypothetical protein L484_012354 [Morus notabilis]|uniref:Uncharacterized protein n=1 Tax=Morus notabilis TaxID=981085 RepID=W9RYG8_9ROSA|nr:hypothetical protein L484_012354 [Morus notabilis]
MSFQAPGMSSSTSRRVVFDPVAIRLLTQCSNYGDNRSIADIGIRSGYRPVLWSDTGIYNSTWMPAIPVDNRPVAVWIPIGIL